MKNNNRPHKSVFLFDHGAGLIGLTLMFSLFHGLLWFVTISIWIFYVLFWHIAFFLGIHFFRSLPTPSIQRIVIATLVIAAAAPALDFFAWVITIPFGNIGNVGYRPDYVFQVSLLFQALFATLVLFFLGYTLAYKLFHLSNRKDRLVFSAISAIVFNFPLLGIIATTYYYGTRFIPFF